MRIERDPKTLRWHAIGAAASDEEAALLVVVHVYRGQNEEEIIRVISAREAGKRERRLYFQ
jgi:uncharacterized DUF497 family protein